jgi:hypothetical protein
LSTRDTVIIDTPAIAATSSMRLPALLRRLFRAGEGVAVDMARNFQLKFMLALTFR